MSRLIAEWQARKAEEAEALHDRVVAAVHSGRADLVTDARMLDHGGSPVHSPWDHLVPLLGLMMTAMIILLAAGMAFGVVAMFLGAVIHLLFTRYYVAWRIQHRTLAFVMQSLAHWQAVWDNGGVALVVKGSGEKPCFAPTGDWKKFVRRLLPQEGEPREVPPAPPPKPEPPKPEPVPPPPPPPPVPEAEIQVEPPAAHTPDQMFGDGASPFGQGGHLELEG
jgi:hypothetical protein